MAVIRSTFVLRSTAVAQVLRGVEVSVYSFFPNSEERNLMFDSNLVSSSNFLHYWLLGLSLSQERE